MAFSISTFFPPPSFFPLGIGDPVFERDLFCADDDSSSGCGLFSELLAVSAIVTGRRIATQFKPGKKANRTAVAEPVGGSSRSRGCGVVRAVDGTRWTLFLKPTVALTIEKQEVLKVQARWRRSVAEKKSSCTFASSAAIQPTHL
jgi:hypothetical protein